MSIQDAVSSSNTPPIALPLTPPTSRLAKVRDILTQARKREAVSRLTPEQRALFERIQRQREKIGPVDFSLNAAIREMRSNG